MPLFRRLRYRAARTKLRAPLVWYRHRGISPSDAFIASYPRSGSTWLRFLLYEILTGDSSGFNDVNRVLADMGRQSNAPALLPESGRLLKTHEVYRPQYEKAIYLVRDARDVAISEYAYETSLERFSGDFDSFVAAFSRGHVNPYGAWHDHVDSWLGSPLAANGNLLLIRFEEMRRDAERTLAQVVEFLGVEATPEVIREAIANNNVQRMQAKEDRAPQIGGNSKNRDRFIRNGSVGDWREKLTEVQARLIEGCARDTLARMGYTTEVPSAEQEVPEARVRD
ncbi:MAG TPA: sulfotransferase domain-containing protein [Terriglobia bacterium]|nr:sulfotransferase domain-containing protein [Terriglobia bacterium]